jgi:hypothetical protein
MKYINEFCRMKAQLDRLVQGRIKTIFMGNIMVSMTIDGTILCADSDTEKEFDLILDAAAYLSGPSGK